MGIELITIIGILILAVIYQGIQIRILRKQTIEAFSKVCLKIFKINYRRENNN